jgi:hypothetical protein
MIPLAGVQSIVRGSNLPSALEWSYIRRPKFIVIGVKASPERAVQRRVERSHGDNRLHFGSYCRLEFAD